MTFTRGSLPLAVALCFAAVSMAGAQGATTSALSGVVVDSVGGVIPGATVSAKSDDTGATSEAVTSGAGTFSIPALNAGVYTVTVSLMGFKTAIISQVRLVPGRPTEIKAALDVGSLSETVVVEGASGVVNTTTPTISSTLNVDQINKMPLPSRNAINAIAFLPGVNTSGVNRDSNFNGLPDSFVAISLDGVNNNENFNKSTEGLFAMVTPRQDAVEAVTVTTAVGGADVGGHGAVQISFVTRSGTNRFTGSAYEYHRNPSLNTNYWFNIRNGLEKNDVRLNQYGVRQGGPIVIPGLYDGHNKAFFFFNYEELRLPNSFSRTRNVLNPTAAQGLFRYTRGTAVEQVDLLALAARSGFSAALDPTVQRVLGYINGATRQTGQLNQQTDPNLMDYVWLSPGEQIEKQPVVRLDYNLSTNHRLSGVYNWQVVDRNPDQLNGGDIRFPGAPNLSHYVSYRPLSSGALRSTLTSNLVNELRGGIRWGPGYFGQSASNGPAHLHGHRRFRARSRAEQRQRRWLERDELAHAERPDRAERLELEHRQHAELAEREAQPRHRHVAVLRQCLGRRPADRARHSAWASTTPIPRSTCSTPPTFRARRRRSSPMRARFTPCWWGRCCRSPVRPRSTRRPTSTNSSAGGAAPAG